MKLLEIMKKWGVNDTPNDIRHFEKEVRDYYYQEFIQERLVGGNYKPTDLDKKVDLGCCNNCLNSDEEFIMEVGEVSVCTKCNNSWLLEIKK